MYNAPLEEVEISRFLGSASSLCGQCLYMGTSSQMILHNPIFEARANIYDTQSRRCQNYDHPCWTIWQPLLRRMSSLPLLITVRQRALPDQARTIRSRTIFVSIMLMSLPLLALFSLPFEHCLKFSTIIWFLVIYSTKEPHNLAKDRLLTVP